MSLSTVFGQQSRTWIIVEMTVCIVVIGALDFLTSYRIRLLPFYAGPIFVVAWFCGARYGILAALFSGVVWWWANWFNGDPDLHDWIQAWEVSRHIGSFLVVAWLGSGLRSRSDIAAARIALLELTRSSFFTIKTPFATGRLCGAPSLAGPPWMGPMVITPVIPLGASAEV